MDLKLQISVVDWKSCLFLTGDRHGEEGRHELKRREPLSLKFHILS